jgi:SpoVK/Ycf46/Vps4 family AAA+-type ATPase
LDKQTLDGLRAAFSSAPSAELAVILVKQLMTEGFDAISDYVSHLRPPIESGFGGMLAEILYNHKKISELERLADPSQAEQAVWLVRAYLDQGKKADARKLYQTIIKQDASVESDGLTNALLDGNVDNDVDTDADTDTDAQHANERPKLRVVEKNEVAEVADLVRYRQSTTNFDDVVGLTEIKKQVHKKIILPFQKPSLFQRFRKKIGGGVLLYGPPGCGKTLLARATAGQCKATFYNIEISDVLDMYIGESEQKLHAIFEKARADVPCVLFFDELEALATKRDHMKGNSTNIVSQFLTELDGFEQKNEGVLILASTNVPWSIDSAFLRPGRFDRMFFVPPPDNTARAAIIEHYLKDRPVDKDIDATWVASKASGFSGADLEHLVDMAADEAIEQSIDSGADVNISFAHLKQALRDARATTIEWLTTARNYARYANDGGRYDDVLEFMKKHGK